MSKEKHFSLRINADLLKKFHYVCEYDGRSANKEILILIRKCIAEFEKEHGEIKQTDLTAMKDNMQWNIAKILIFRTSLPYPMPYSRGIFFWHKKYYVIK